MAELSADVNVSDSVDESLDYTESSARKHNDGIVEPPSESTVCRSIVDSLEAKLKVSSRSEV